MSKIQFASALEGAEAFNQNNVNRTYRGQILTNKGTVNAIIKDINKIELVNELLAASLGKSLGLPIPSCYLTRVSKGIIDTVCAPKFSDGSALVFASEDVMVPNTAVQIIASASAKGAVCPTNTNTFKEMVSDLIEWKKLGDLYAFDAWVANVDRNIGNILWGGRNKVWLIDHGQCFSGPDWPNHPLDPDNFYDNKLESWITPSMNYEQKNKKSVDAGKMADLILQQNVDGHMEEIKNKGILDAGILSRLEDFLVSRKNNVRQCADSALHVSGLI